MENPIFKLEGIVRERSQEQMQDFEGPLDLILYLLSKNKIEIQDIPIALILDQYLEYIERRKSMDLEVASEFITMAAHLMYIKTRMLLSIEDEEAQSEMDLLIQSLDRARNQEDHQTAVTTALIWAGVVFVCVGLPLLLDHTDFAIDYGLWGVLLPVFIYLGRDQKEKLLLTGAGLVLLALSFTGTTQWFSLLTLPLLALYNGQRGKRQMKYFFYVYYPLHLAVIYGISLLI